MTAVSSVDGQQTSAGYAPPILLISAALAGAAFVAVAAGVALLYHTRNVDMPAGMDGVNIPFFLTWLVFAAVGLLLAVKRPGHAMGWLLLIVAAAWSLQGLAGAYRIAALLQHPDWPAAAWSAWLWDWLWVPGIASVFLIALLFPSGRLPSPRWWPVVVALIAAAVPIGAAVALQPGVLPSTPGIDNPAGIPALSGLLGAMEGVGTLLFVVAGLAALASPILRFRRAGSLERQQIKWFAAASFVILVAFLAASALEAAGANPDLLGLVRVTPLVLLPLAIAAAVLQYRLYDIDIVINRSIVYGALAGLIGLVYVVIVVGAGEVIGSRGEANVALSIAATAVAALAFAPARARLQLLADRLVYGRGASPYEALASITSRISGAASEPTVLEDMARTVAEASGALSATVWLRVEDELHSAACWPESSPPAALPLPLEGEPIRLRGADHVYPVRRQGRLLGAFGLTMPRDRSLRGHEEALIRDLASAAWLVLENLALIDELRASRLRLVTAQDNERARIERNLHDGAQQRLLEVALTLRQAQQQAGAGDAAATLDAAQTQLRAALHELREFARGLHPAILTSRGLVPALESLAERAPLPVKVAAADIPRLTPQVEATAYFAASESLTNVIKHANATQATITLSRAHGWLHVRVTDDGAGGADAEAPGLKGLSDRVATLGGRLSVRSHPGSGTVVEVDLPCE